MRPWPIAEESYLVEDVATLIVQVNGKVRDRIEVAADADEATCTDRALESDKVQSYLSGAEPRKVIVRAPNLVNFVL